MDACVADTLCHGFVVRNEQCFFHADLPAKLLKIRTPRSDDTLFVLNRTANPDLIGRSVLAAFIAIAVFGAFLAFLTPIPP